MSNVKSKGAARKEKTGSLIVPESPRKDSPRKKKGGSSIIGRNLSNIARIAAEAASGAAEAVGEAAASTLHRSSSLKSESSGEEDRQYFVFWGLQKVLSEADEDLKDSLTKVEELGGLKGDQFKDAVEWIESDNLDKYVQRINDTLKNNPKTGDIFAIFAAEVIYSNHPLHFLFSELKEGGEKRSIKKDSDSLAMVRVLEDFVVHLADMKQMADIRLEGSLTKPARSRPEIKKAEEAKPAVTASAESSPRDYGGAKLSKDSKQMSDLERRARDAFSKKEGAGAKKERFESLVEARSSEQRQQYRLRRLVRSQRAGILDVSGVQEAKKEKAEDGKSSAGAGEGLPVCHAVLVPPTASGTRRRRSGAISKSEEELSTFSGKALARSGGFRNLAKIGADSKKEGGPAL